MLHIVCSNLQCLGEGASTGNIVQILLGLAKSYFNVKGKSDPAIQVHGEI